MQFGLTSSTSFALIAFVAISKVQSAPTALQARSDTPQIACEPTQNSLNKGQLYSGPGYYGGNQYKLGYKYITNSDGNEEVILVNEDENDPTIRLLSNVIEVQCNSTYLNVFSHPGQFGANTPVKMLADVGQDGIPFCIGLKDPNASPTSLALVPCSSSDNESQANQFWVSQFKYANIFPLIGKSDSSESVNNFQYVQPPAQGANPPVYTTVPDCGNDCNSDYSFTIA